VGVDRHIPGVKSVRSGGKYKPYAAAQVQNAKKAVNCKTARSGGYRLALNAYGQKCKRAGKVAAQLDAAPAIRNATAVATDLEVKAGSETYVCAVDPTRHGRALRSVSCQSGKRTLWWAASKRRG
jgi:hypothetical protein